MGKQHLQQWREENHYNHDSEQKNILCVPKPPSAKPNEKERLAAIKKKWENGGKQHLQQWREENHYNHDSEQQNTPCIPYASLSAFDKALLLELLKNGKIHTMKLLREKTGDSLTDAKRHVENLELYIPTYSEFTNDSDISLSSNDDISFIDGMEGCEFEHYCAQLLEKVGFTDVSVTPASGDQGVDILAAKEGIKYAVQCKNYATPLGNTPIQEVHAGKVFYNCHVGVVMTNSTFTPKAKELAIATGVLLWDRTTIQELIIASNPAPKTTTTKEFSTDCSSAI